MSKLQELEYDGERVFPDNAVFPPGVAEAAELLEQYELEELLIECQGAVECSHPDYKTPKDLLEKAKPELIEFLSNYYDPETGELWMLGN